MIELDDIVACLNVQGSVGVALPSLGDHAAFSEAVIDSRAVTRGALFVALPGEHVDGHQFVDDALSRGARGALVRRDWAAQHLHTLDRSVAVVVDADTLALVQHNQPIVFAVDEPLTTLQQISARHRQRMSAQVIGITGSVGKTSTKEATAAVLRSKRRTLASGKSYNNEIGVPLTLLRLEPEHEAAVIEMGTYGPGEIAFLCELAQPQIGIVTNVGVSHLDRMKTQDVIAQAKGELIEALPPDGVAILNADDHRVRAMADRTQAHTLLYGLDQSADLWADAVQTHGLDGLSFVAHYNGTARRLRVPLLGRHSVYIALPALAAGLALGLNWDAIAAGLAQAETMSRVTPTRGINGALILDDTYNAAPASCKAALDILADVPGRRTAVFGAMAELGPIEEQAHREVGAVAAQVVDRLVVVGDLARWIGDEARRQRPDLDVLFAATNADAVAALRPSLERDDVVLVKGARAARTEEIVAGLRTMEQER